MNTKGLERAALNYLHALEGEGSIQEVEAAKEKLAEVAVLWAQAEATTEVHKQHKSKKAKGR